jgi:hypothetical protein
MAVKTRLPRAVRLHRPCSDASTAMAEMIKNFDISAFAGTTSDADLLAHTAAAVRKAGSTLRERFGAVVRYQTREELSHRHYPPTLNHQHRRTR